MKKFFTEEEMIEICESVAIAIEEHGWLCEDGHWLTDEELMQYTYLFDKQKNNIRRIL